MQTGGWDRLLDHHDLELGSGHTACWHVSLINFYLHTKFRWNPNKLFVAGWMDSETNFIKECTLQYKVFINIAWYKWLFDNCVNILSHLCDMLTKQQTKSNDKLSKMLIVICSRSLSPLFRSASSMRRTSKSGPHASFHIIKALYACKIGRSPSIFFNAPSRTSAGKWAISDSKTGLQSAPSARDTSRRTLLVRRISVCNISDIM